MLAVAFRRMYAQLMQDSQTASLVHGVRQAALGCLTSPKIKLEFSSSLVDSKDKVDDGGPRYPFSTSLVDEDVEAFEEFMGKTNDLEEQPEFDRQQTHRRLPRKSV